MLYPFTFKPVFMDRVWGGNGIQKFFGKNAGTDKPVGESWEITDRPEGVSLISNGPLAGKDLCWLMTNHRNDLMGNAKDQDGRFPLLVKILDARDKLSLQVHPPAAIAEELGGEPKTEMWYIVHAEPGADLFVGLKKGVSRDAFEAKIADGTVADCFHRIEVKDGDAMFLPSGRVHAIGAGNVIFEIQQNSDTTYRVFDWNRVGLDGQPRELQVDESLQSINFEDFEPGLVNSEFVDDGAGKRRMLVDDPLFKADLRELSSGKKSMLNRGLPVVIGVARGNLTVSFEGSKTLLSAGGFCLIPACCENVSIEAQDDSQFLEAVPA